MRVRAQLEPCRETRKAIAEGRRLRRRRLPWLDQDACTVGNGTTEEGVPDQARLLSLAAVAAIGPLEQVRSGELGAGGGLMDDRSFHGATSASGSEGAHISPTL